LEYGIFTLLLANSGGVSDLTLEYGMAATSPPRPAKWNRHTMKKANWAIRGSLLNMQRRTIAIKSWPWPDTLELDIEVPGINKTKQERK